MMGTFERRELLEVYEVHKDTMNDENLPTWLSNMLVYGFADGLYYGYDKRFFGLVFHSSKVVRIGQLVGRDSLTNEIKIVDKTELKLHYREL